MRTQVNGRWLLLQSSFAIFYFPASTCYIRLYMFVVERMYKSNTPLPPPPPPPPPSSTFIQVTSGFPK
ncbi:hypothetical protein DERF_015897 [Dermatophagoides farinae]|uniref:Uncharacterized protein n=1 Tax=Dermatophagoides farinae TaxID=6954 RepID=A0A922HKP4_DERFA|nr:hypothetical protein DERF_015897 [Dermatophagoides farinae]